MEENLEVLDYSNKKLKKLNKPNAVEAQVHTLLLDNNDLQRLDNIDSFVKLQKLSAVRNQLLRMYGVCRLHSLHTLILAYNGILTIEGLKELVNLKWLCLAGNSIKTIEHLTTNVNLEHLDLSENNITHISDLSFLKNLKELFLHKNKINHLGQCDRFLPVSLMCLTLSHNNITDLNEISRLVNLTHLKKLSIANNPCVNMTGSNIGFDYRPFVINWCLNINVIDDYVVDAIESLRAEWLYSQGRGRHFRVGDQKELVQYLASVCPLTGETLETEDDRKLRLILSKAQHHQQQLRDQQTGDIPIPSPIARKKIHSNRQSPRLNSTRLNNNKVKSPDIMSSSMYTGTNDAEDAAIMTQSFDPSMLRQSVLTKSTVDSTNYVPPEKYIESELVNSPLQALSKMVPVPENLMSPDYRPPPITGRTTIPTPNNKVTTSKIVQPIRSPKLNAVSKHRTHIQSSDIRKTNCRSPVMQKRQQQQQTSNESVQNNKKTSILRRSNSSEEESEICDSKLQTIQQRVEEKRLQKDAEANSESSTDDKVEQAAVFIQKIWRGYHTRNKNKEVQEMFRTLQNQRANQYIQKLATDMETTKAALDSERKIQMLQTEAISALWKKISALQPNNHDASCSVNMTDLTVNNTEVVKELALTCTMLQNQIQQLQCSMQDIVKVMTAFSQTTSFNQHLKENGIATQTEIVAVHTPQGDAGKVFPFQKQTRPSSLPLPVHQRIKKDNNTQMNGNNISTTTNTTTVHSELKEFADTLVDGVIKTVSETKADCIGVGTMEITVTDTDQQSDLFDPEV